MNKIKMMCVIAFTVFGLSACTRVEPSVMGSGQMLYNIPVK